MRALVIASLCAACGTDRSAPARDLQLTASFRVEPGQERYECYRQNVDRDVFVTQIATTSAPGVHHQILGVADRSKPEGSAPCETLGLSVAESWLFVGADAPRTLDMPPDVAYRVPAGSQLVLQLHLFNPGDAPLASNLTIDLTGIAEAEVVHRAQLIAAGSLQIDLPPAQAATVRGSCTLPRDVALFGVLPHMHYTGTQFQAQLVVGETTTMLYDDAFHGEAQAFTRFEPLAMPAGSKLTVQCSYFNNTPERITYGESAREEMCFGFTYFYPAIDEQGTLCLK